MKKIKWLYIGILSMVILVGCSDVPTEEEVTKAVADKVEEEVNKAVEQTIDKVKEEGKQTAEDLVEEGTNKLNEWLSGTSENSSETNQSTEVLQTNGTTEQYQMKYISNYDGDTIKLAFLEGPNKGQEIKVRHLLFDSSEIAEKHPFSKEAQKRAQEILESGNVTLEYDIGSTLDKYGRTLAYLRIDGEHLGTSLISEGLARVAYVFPPNTRYLDEFKAAEKIAKDKGIGIWSIENYATDSGFKP